MVAVPAWSADASGPIMEFLSGGRSMNSRAIGRRYALIALPTVLLALLAATSAGTTAAATSVVRALPRPGALDYASRTPSHLGTLEPSFVAGQLGGAPGLVQQLLHDPTAPGAAALAQTASVVRSITLPCVGGHQTADPLSPPCAADFHGDNGGTTYPGVTPGEIKVLVVIAPGEELRATRQPAWGTYYDLGRAPQASESGEMAGWLNRLRLFQAYFNRHYQTYGRHVHFVVYSVDQIGTGLSNACRNIALENYALVHPYAALLAVPGDEIPSCYGETMASLGVATLDMTREHDEAYYQRYPGLNWGFRPTSTEAATIFGSYLCQKVVGKPVAMSGNLNENGGVRRLGLLVVDPAQHREMAELTRAVVRRCGGTFVDTQTITVPIGACGAIAGAISNAPAGYPARDVAAALASFRAHGVTTIVWPGCTDQRPPTAAAAAHYLPEWVLWGSSLLDSDPEAAFGNVGGFVDSWTGHAVLVTPATYKPYLTQRLCWQALHEVDPAVPNDDFTWVSCDWYDGFRQLFTLFQLAGPRLTPGSMDAGARSFSVRLSTPQVPRCEYPAGDYTCTKDAQVDWWDASLTTRFECCQTVSPLLPTLRGAGCWRAMQGGRRFDAWRWPPGNIDAQIRSSDACTYQGVYPAP